MKVEYRKREIDKYSTCLYCENGLVNHAWAIVGPQRGAAVISLVLDCHGNKYRDLSFLN